MCGRSFKALPPLTRPSTFKQLSQRSTSYSTLARHRLQRRKSPQVKFFVVLNVKKYFAYPFSPYHLLYSLHIRIPLKMKTKLEVILRWVCDCKDKKKNQSIKGLDLELSRWIATYFAYILCEQEWYMSWYFSTGWLFKCHSGLHFLFDHFFTIIFD